MTQLSDLVPEFEKKVKDKKEFKAREKHRKIMDKVQSVGKITTSLSDIDRDRWEATFGKKTGDDIPGRCRKAVAGEDEVQAHKDSAGCSDR